MPVQLTGKTLARLLADAKRSGQRKGVTDAGCEGLMARASPNGKVIWRGSCRDKSGTQQWATHGEYGEHGLSIAAARRAQEAFRVAVHSGGPLPERRRRPKDTALAREVAAEQETTPVVTSTLGALINLYERQKGHTLRSWPHGHRRIARVFGSLFDTPLGTLTLGDLQLTADNYRTPGEAGFATRTLHPVFTWAAHPGRGYVPQDFQLLRAPSTVKQRERYLSDDELAALMPVLRARASGYAQARAFAALAPEIDIRLHWHHLDLNGGSWARPAHRGKPASQIPLPHAALAFLRQMPPGQPYARTFPYTGPHAAIMLFLLWTMARREEAAAANWGSIDLERGLWTIERERTKNSQTHLVPLSCQAIELLRTLGPGKPDELIFPSIGSGAVANNWDRESKVIAAAAGIRERFHRHDLRRSASTLLGDLGELPHVIKAQLNHVTATDPIDARYNRSRYLQDRANAVQRLADALDGLHADGARIIAHPALGRSAVR